MKLRRYINNIINKKIISSVYFEKDKIIEHYENILAHLKKKCKDVDQKVYEYQELYNNLKEKKVRKYLSNT